MKVMIADPSVVVREQIRFLLSAVPDIECMEETDNVQDTLDMIRTRNPHVVVLDNAMPCSGEFTVLRQVKYEELTPALIMLKAFSFEVCPNADLEDEEDFVRDEIFVDQPLALAVRQLAQLSGVS